MKVAYKNNRQTDLVRTENIYFGKDFKLLPFKYFFFFVTFTLYRFAFLTTLIFMFESLVLKMKEKNNMKSICPCTYRFVGCEGVSQIYRAVPSFGSQCHTR